MASSIPAEKLETRVEIRIGNLAVDEKLGKLVTPNRKGRYPEWAYFEHEFVELEKELTFESDMRITLQNKKTKFFGDFSNYVIGEFSVPVDSMLSRCDKP